MFGESIYYNDASPLSSTTPQYNGNISGITWRSRIEASGKPGVSTAPQGNSYDYDNLDRHFKNNYFTYSGGSFNPAAGRPLTETISGYDLMGNIQEMYRVDKGGVTINDQFYYYHPYSNKIDSIYDEGTQSITGTFTYDGNGNLTYDSRKDIHITYNYLDLPDTVSKGSSKLVFTYDAAGNKLYKQLIVGGTVVAQRHYVENLEATATSSLTTDGRIDFALMDEGRIVNTPDSGYRYEYYLTDHLGNNRVMFRTDSLGHVRLSMVQNYYPFGSDMGDSTMNYSLNPNNFYKYSNKELQPELDLDTYDFGARHYDPIIGRWMGIDPLASSYDDQSPYNYVGNNPMNSIDPDGMQYGTGTGKDFTFITGSGTPADEPIITRNLTGNATGGFNWWSVGGAALSAGAGLYNAWGAFSFKTPKTQNWANNLNAVQRNPIVSGLNDFGAGFMNAFGSDMTGFNLPMSSHSSRNIYNFARSFGHGAAMFASTIEIDFGANMGAVGIAGTPETGGLSLSGTAAGALIITHGLFTARNAFMNMIIGKGEDVGGQSGNPDVQPEKPAEELPKGFKETNEFGLQHGQKVYKKGNKFYSLDVAKKGGQSSHNGGVWKVFKRVGNKIVRIGTANKNLKIFKK